MSIDRIVVWLRLKDTARFKRAAHSAAEAIREIGHAAEDGEGPLNQLGGLMSSLGSVLPDVTGRTRIFGFAVGTVFTAFALSLPVVIALGGALVALAGSLGAAALGATALGAALGGALLAPLGALGLVLADSFQGFSKASTAYTNWQKAVNAFGRNSKQAETALARLNAVAQVFGGQYLVQAVDAWNKLINDFRKANAGTMRIVLQTFTEFLGVARQLMPTFAYIAHLAGVVMHDAFKKLVGVLTSSGFVTIIRGFAESLAAIGPKVADTILNFVGGVFILASRAAPALGWLVDEIYGLSAAFQSWATNSNVGALIGHFREWWNLTKAIGGLLVTILSGGAADGQDLVVSLTQIVNRWNSWLKTMEGQKSLHSFFDDAIALTKEFLGATAGLITFLFRIGRTAMPFFTKGLQAVHSAIHQVMLALDPMQPFLQNVLGPLLKGIAEGVLSSVVGSFRVLVFVLKVVATVLGFIGRVVGPSFKGFFETLGKVIGFVAGGAILKLLQGLGKLSILLKPMSYAFRLLALPLTMAGKLIGFLGAKVFKLAGAFLGLAGRFIPAVRNAIFSVLDFLAGTGSKFYDAGVRIWTRLKDGLLKAIGAGLGFAGDIAKAVANAVITLLNTAIPNKIPVPFGPDINLPDNPIPHLASGGTVHGSGAWITGESGPELNRIISGGRVQVVPLAPGIKAQGSSATLAPGSGSRTIVSQVYLRGRMIAEAVADELDADRARR